MKVLLDTHVIIWALTDSKLLSNEARNIISSRDNVIYCSTASLWEISIKNQKFPERFPWNEKVISQYCTEAGFEILGINPNHVEAIRTLRIQPDSSLVNYDPFDRMLISQAKSEGMKLISHDSNFENYAEECIIMI